MLRVPRRTLNDWDMRYLVHVLLRTECIAFMNLTTTNAVEETP